VVLDREGRIINLNRTALEITGYSFEQVEGRLLWDVFLIPEEMEPVKKVFRSLAGGQFPNSFTNQWLTKTGERRLIEWTNTAVTELNGEVDLIIGTGVDITSSRAVEEALRKSIRDLADIKAALDEHSIVAITDQRGIINYVNEKFCEISKYSRE